MGGVPPPETVLFVVPGYFSWFPTEIWGSGPISRGYPPLRGGYPPLRGGYPPLGGGTPPTLGFQTQISGSRPEIRSGMPEFRFSAIPAKFWHPGEFSGVMFSPDRSLAIWRNRSPTSSDRMAKIVRKCRCRNLERHPDFLSRQKSGSTPLENLPGGNFWQTEIATGVNFSYS
jgi:hypothetical protein